MSTETDNNQGLSEDKNNSNNPDNYEIDPEIKLSMEKVLKESERNKDKPLNIGIILIYLIPNNQNLLQLFGIDFVKRNKDKCYIIYYNKSTKLSQEYDLITSFRMNRIPFIKYQPEIFEIMLVQTDYFNDMSFMFAG